MIELIAIRTINHNCRFYTHFSQKNILNQMYQNESYITNSIKVFTGEAISDHENNTKNLAQLLQKLLSCISCTLSTIIEMLLIVILNIYV